MPTSKKRVKKSSRPRKLPRNRTQRNRTVAEDELVDTSAHVPVWMYDQLAAELAAGPPLDGVDPTPAETWMKILAAYPIRLKNPDSQANVTSVWEIAEESGQTIDDVVASFDVMHSLGYMAWDQEHETHLLVVPATGLLPPSVAD